MKQFFPLAAAALFAFTGPGAEAQGLNQFDGRTVTFVVGSDTGGGYDTMARLVAEHMEIALTGSTFVVANEPRASGLVALNRLYADTSDDPALMMFNTGLLLQQLTGDPKLRADFLAFDYIGKVTSEARYVVASEQSGLASWADVLAADGPLLMPASSVTSSAYVQSQMIGFAFDLPLNRVTGFSGSESRAAIVKGEMQLTLTSENNVARLEKAGGAVPILRFGPASGETYASVTGAEAVATTPEQGEIVAAITGMTKLGRVILAKPALSPEDLAALQAAFETAVASEAFQAAAAEMELTLDPAGSAATKALVSEVLGSETLAEIVKAALQ